ncbi:L10-interacting MYB domain-containing protein [Arachis hypogaea]|nr:L10-interacting MYB domain-containing protein [Arachis hypogaea]
MDEAVLNALAEEALKGNRHDGSWITEAYANVMKTLSIAIGQHITKNYIKNRMKTLKDHFAEAYDLFHHLSGFAWNPVTRKFEAEKEAWQEFIKEKSHAKKWKKCKLTTCRDPIDLNDSFENIGFSDIDVNMGHDIPTFSANLDSPTAPHSQSNQLGGT